MKRQQSLLDWMHHRHQIFWAHVGILGGLLAGGQWTEDHVGELQTLKNKSVSGCEQWALFPWHFWSQSPSPRSCGEVSTLVLYSVSLRRFQWPTQVFPYKFLRAFKNGTLSPSSKFQSTWTFHPKLFGTHKGLSSILSKFHGEKQNKWTAPLRLPFSFKAPMIPQWQKKTHRLWHFCPATAPAPCQNLHISDTKVSSLRSPQVNAQVGSRGWFAERGHFGAAPVVRVKLSVPYVSLGPWDSLTKFNCSKRPHQQALSTPIRPRPIVSGQGVRCFCPTAQNPDSSQTGPSCRFIQQIMPVKGCSGPKAVTVWIAVACLHCQGFSVTRL